MKQPRKCTYCKAVVKSHVWLYDGRDYCAPWCDPERVAHRDAVRKAKKARKAKANSVA